MADEPPFDSRVVVRPGPSFIPAGEAPGGMVFHVYAVPSDLLLTMSCITPGDDVEAEAERAGALICELLDNASWATCVVAFDGDTGYRLRPGEWLEALLR